MSLPGGIGSGGLEVREELSRDLLNQCGVHVVDATRISKSFAGGSETDVSELREEPSRGIRKACPFAGELLQLHYLLCFFSQ